MDKFQIVVETDGARLYIKISKIFVIGSSNVKSRKFNQFQSNVPFPYFTPENVRKPCVFWCFHGTQKGKIGLKWVNRAAKPQNVSKAFFQPSFLPMSV